MSLALKEQDLPEEISTDQAVETAYSSALAEIGSDLTRGLPVLVECDKDLTPYVYMAVRRRAREQDLRCLLLDGRPREGDQAPPGGAACGFIGTMVAQLRDAVRGAVEKRVVVLPHLDLMTTSQGVLTAEAREVIALLYENPELVWLGFKDPSFPLPRVIENLFPHRYDMLGVPRERLQYLVTRREARKFGTEFNPWALYKYVSGMNAARLRKMLASIEGEDYPADPKRAYNQIRQATTGGSLEIPDIDLTRDIGGYKKVKDRLQSEILDVLKLKDEQTTPEAIRRMEELLPKGMIFLGPPGTGKTLFAKGMATAIGAAITVVSGPELKSKWVGESEENLRQIFHKARQSAPAIIVFDELDSFASARGTYTGSGVEHSMVNQLLTEMDGFRKEELVFVVGTTNFVESLDPALLRPGRFEFHLHIPYPQPEDRREIIEIYNKKMALEMSEDAIEYAVRRTGEFVEGAMPGTHFSGDHINAMCRAMARIRIREEKTGASEVEHVERALTEWVERPKMTKHEEKVVATHEAGHAICALFCEHSAAIERISILADTAGALGYVKHQDPAHRYVITRSRLLDDLCVLMGGREAEDLLLKDLSIGSSGDLNRATDIARSLVEEFGMGGDAVGLGQVITESRGNIRRQFSEEQLQEVDRQVRRILEDARVRAADLLKENKPLLVTLRDLLLEHKVIDAKRLGEMMPETKDLKSIASEE